MGAHRPEGGILGQLHGHRRQVYHSGYASLLFRASAADLPLSGAQRPFRSHLFQRKAGSRKQGRPPSKAGQRSAGANGAKRDRWGPMPPPLTSVFLCRYIGDFAKNPGNGFGMALEWQTNRRICKGGLLQALLEMVQATVLKALTT